MSMTWLPHRSRSNCRICSSLDDHIWQAWTPELFIFWLPELYKLRLPQLIRFWSPDLNRLWLPWMDTIGLPGLYMPGLPYLGRSGLPVPKDMVNRLSKAGSYRILFSVLDAVRGREDINYHDSGECIVALSTASHIIILYGSGNKSWYTNAFMMIEILRIQYILILHRFNSIHPNYHNYYGRISYFKMRNNY